MILLENSQIPRGLSKNDYFSDNITSKPRIRGCFWFNRI